MNVRPNGSRLRCYFIGPIQHARRLGQPWREHIGQLLKPLDIECSNPNALEARLTRKSTTEIICERTIWKETGQWKKFHDQMWKIRVLDIAWGVLSSDFVVLYWPIGIEKGGTLDELYCAARSGIPIFVVISGRRRDMNDWIYDVLCELEKEEYDPSIKDIMGTGLTKFAKIFPSFKSVARYLAEHREELLYKKQILRDRGIIDFRPQMAPLFLRPGAVFDYVWHTKDQYLAWLEAHPAYKVDKDLENILWEIYEGYN